MKPSQRYQDEPTRHHDDLTELDFYRRRATELRARAMRNNVGLRAICLGLLMIVAFPVAFAVSAASLHTLSTKLVAQPSVTPAR